MDLRSRGFTWDQIGEQVGISHQAARESYYKTLAEIPVATVEQHRREQVERLDWLLAEARAVLERRHLVVRDGKVVTLTIEGDGTEEPIAAPVIDDGPTLEAVRTILQIEKLRAELLGTQAPQRVEVAEVVRYEIVGVNLDALR